MTSCSYDKDGSLCPGIVVGDFLSKIGGQITGVHKFSGKDMLKRSIQRRMS